MQTENGRGSSTLKRLLISLFCAACGSGVPDQSTQLGPTNSIAGSPSAAPAARGGGAGVAALGTSGRGSSGAAGIRSASAGAAASAPVAGQPSAAGGGGSAAGV